MQETTSLIALCAIVLSAGCDPTAPPSNSLTIEDSPGATTWRAAGAGTYNSCAIDVDGAPYCWGFDLVDPCPTTSCTVLWVPTRFPAAAAPLKSVAVGATMACGVATDDNVYCWGEGLGVGTLGDGVTKKSRTPVRVALPGPAVQLTAGYSGECALLADATIWCWNESAVLPTKLDSQVRFAKLSTNYPACAIAENGDAYCWGGGYGRLGIGDADTDCQYGPSCLSTKVPLLVVGGHKWIDISVGSVSACGITTDHRAYCWGEMYPELHGRPARTPRRRVVHRKQVSAAGRWRPAVQQRGRRDEARVRGRDRQLGVLLGPECQWPTRRWLWGPQCRITPARHRQPGF
jgi:alpha-tubulin suppressor-like RCC1 family protein